MAEKYAVGEQSVADVRLGGYYVFTPPTGVVGGGVGTGERPGVWYGTKKLREYSGAFVDGQVVKVNPKSVVIRNVTVGDWNYGHEYKIPKDARATRDLTAEMLKTTSFKPVQVAGADSTKAKEPWQMTREEYVSKVTEYWKKQHSGQTPSETAESYIAFEKGKRNPVNESEVRGRYFSPNAWHKEELQRALSEGKPIPPEVLRDYPDLAKQVWGDAAEPSANLITDLKTMGYTGNKLDKALRELAPAELEAVASPAREVRLSRELAGQERKAHGDTVVARTLESGADAIEVAKIRAKGDPASSLSKDELITAIMKFVPRGSTKYDSTAKSLSALHTYELRGVLSDLQAGKGEGGKLAELQSVESARSPLSQSSDERQEHSVVIEPDSPAVAKWLKDPGRMDVRGIDTSKRRASKPKRSSRNRDKPSAGMGAMRA